MIWFIAILLSIAVTLLVVIIIQIHFVSNYIVDILLKRASLQSDSIHEVLAHVKDIDKVTRKMRSEGY